MDLPKLFAQMKTDPALYMRALLKEEPSQNQKQLFDAIRSGEKRISIRSGRQCHKTSAIAILSQWFLTAFRDTRVLVTAPSSSQLEDAYIPEFKKWVNRLPPEFRDLWEIKKDRFEFVMDPRQPFENFITIKTARKDSPESMQGMNAPNVAVFIDEAAGVDENIFESISGSLAGNTGNVLYLLTGNPNRTSGTFYRSHSDQKDRWHTIHWSSEEAPWVSREWIQGMKDDWGYDSDPYRVHVMGEFPRGDSNTVIPVDLVDSAMMRDVEVMRTQPIVWGLDVARFGADESVLAYRQGNVGGIKASWRNLDTMQLAAQVEAHYQAAGQRPTEILVDVIGIGAGVVDRLRQLDLPIRGINVSESPALKGQHLNLRSELWYQVRAWLEQRDCRLDSDDELRRQMLQQRFEYTPQGKIKLESKRDARKRGARSPDRADAFALTFAGKAAKLGGRAHDWKKPIKRLIPRLV